MKDGSLIFDAIDMGQAKGSEASLVLMSLRSVKSRAGGPLLVPTGMSFVYSLLVCGDLIAF